MVLIDDFSRMCWVYFLKQKSEVASVFWKFKTWIENQSGCKIKVIRSDNGTEYTADKFAKFCEAAGIEHQLTATYTPQQNGVSERKNRTVMEMARCLLFEKEMPKMFWADAVNTAIFLQNRLPTNALKGKTPFEAWFGFKPSINNLRIFGCITKLNADGSVNKFKARLVVKGYAQLFGVDFSETFAPVARLDTIRLLLALAAQKQWKIYQLDQPEGFVADLKKVYLLKKALYGLKQAPRAWYSRIDDHLLNIGFNKSMSESTLYIQVINHELIVVSLYVDDLLVTGSNEELVKQFKVQMMQAFEMTDLGEMTFFLGLEIQKSQQGIFIGQQKYAKEVLKKFNMEDCKSVCTPLAQNEKFSKDDGAEKIDEALYRSLIGCLMYLTATRPDIMFTVSLLSRYMHCASELHYKAAKRVLRYIKGTLDHGIKFEKEDKLILHGFADSD
ncbi:hypothetical protein KPL70_011388 [Citrus sinensis]|nr:hypothetical protein KPL70_011388 [Citrus sinensis]